VESHAQFYPSLSVGSWHGSCFRCKCRKWRKRGL